MTTITEPGLYDLPAAVYLSDPIPGGSLSQSRAKVLLREAGPARFKYLETAPEHKPEFDLGTTAHALVLGKGVERIVVVNKPTWATKEAKEAKEAAYADSKTPVLAHQLRQAEDMAAKIAGHAQAMEILTGRSEVAMFAPIDGLWLRGQMDKYAAGSHIGDYKTTSDAGSRFERSAFNFGYHIQAAWYRELVRILTGETLPFRIVAQETKAPYLVSVWEFPDSYLDLGQEAADTAISIYRRCVEANQWPGYPDEIQLLKPPAWAYDDDFEIGA